MPTNVEFQTSYYIQPTPYHPPFYGGETQKTKPINGGNMEEQLQRYHDYLCGEHTKHNTITNKLGAIRTLLQQTQGIINPETIQQLKIWANQHYSHNSRNNRINAWNQYLRWSGQPEYQMKHIGFIETNQYALEEPEINLILKEARRDELTNLIVLFLFDGALRPSEIIDIRLNRRDGSRLYLDDTKTGDKRIILSPMLIQAWDDYLRIRPTPQPGYEQYLILKANHKQPGTKYGDTDSIIKMTKNIGRLANIKKTVTPYTIRRTSVTLRQNKYSNYYMGDIKLVQALFRHKDIATTLRYDRTSDLDIERYFDEQAKRDKPGVSGINQDVNGINTREHGANLIYYCSPQEEINTGEGNDSVSFSFSITFFNEQETKDLIGVMPRIMSPMGWSTQRRKEP
jgi:integrase